MQPEVDSESGLGSDAAEAYEQDFYQSYVPVLERQIRRHRQILDSDDDDPTIDLRSGEVALRTQPQQHKSRQHQDLQEHMTESPPDLVIQELNFLCGEVRRGTHYGQKLVTVMLQGLMETLGPVMFEEFASGKLPHQWVPIVRINSDNCPYVEFLIKSDKSDHAPAQQLIEYKEEHLALSHLVVQKIQDRALDTARQTTKSNCQVARRRSDSSRDYARTTKDVPMHSTPRKTVFNINNQYSNSARRDQPAKECRQNINKKLPTHSTPRKTDNCVDPLLTGARRVPSTKEERGPSSCKRVPPQPGAEVTIVQDDNHDLDGSRRKQPARKCRVSQVNYTM